MSFKNERFFFDNKLVKQKKRTTQESPLELEKAIVSFIEDSKKDVLRRCEFAFDFMKEIVNIRKKERKGLLHLMMKGINDGKKEALMIALFVNPHFIEVLKDITDKYIRKFEKERKKIKDSKEKKRTATVFCSMLHYYGFIVSMKTNNEGVITLDNYKKMNGFVKKYKITSKDYLSINDQIDFLESLFMMKKRLRLHFEKTPEIKDNYTRQSQFIKDMKIIVKQINSLLPSSTNEDNMVETNLFNLKNLKGQILHQIGITYGQIATMLRPNFMYFFPISPTLAFSTSLIRGKALDYLNLAREFYEKKFTKNEFNFTTEVSQKIDYSLYKIAEHFGELAEDITICAMYLRDAKREAQKQKHKVINIMPLKFHKKQKELKNAYYGKNEKKLKELKNDSYLKTIKILEKLIKDAETKKRTKNSMAGQNSVSLIYVNMIYECAKAYFGIESYQEAMKYVDKGYTLCVKSFGLNFLSTVDYLQLKGKIYEKMGGNHLKQAKLCIKKALKHVNFMVKDTNRAFILTHLLKRINDKIKESQIKQLKPSKIYTKCCYLFCNKVETEGKKFKVCSVCKSVKYCSRECQKKAWKTHKKICTKQS